jgi:S-adenosylmethionine hydrolase
LLTDFGTQDYYVGAMKGAIYEINPNVLVVDLTHDVPPHDLLAGAFTLACCYYDFPLHTIHVAVVDPGVGSKRRPILMKTENYYFIGPDNGIFSFIYDRENVVGVWEIEASHYLRKNVSSTFHGRDIFAPVAGHVSRLMSGDEFGREIDDYARIPIPKPAPVGDRQMKGFVLLADRFGNVITNYETAELQAFMASKGLKRFSLTVAGKTVASLARNYAEGQGELFLVPGSAGYLEVAANQKSAARILNAQRGMELLLNFE